MERLVLYIGGQSGRSCSKVAPREGDEENGWPEALLVLLIFTGIGRECAFREGESSLLILSIEGFMRGTQLSKLVLLLLLLLGSDFIGGNVRSPVEWEKLFGAKTRLSQSSCIHMESEEEAPLDI
jgi:hypothetical protein